MPLKPENCSICNLERLTIAEADRKKALNTRNKLAIITTNVAIFEFNLNL